jgi:hypothetical protein
MPRAKQAPAAAADNLVSRRVLVNIKRDQTTTTPRVVWAHEVPILELVWGEGNVTVVEAEEVDEGFRPRAAPDMLVHNKTQDEFRPPSESLSLGWAFITDHRAEYDRLADVYGNVPETRTPYVEAAYGRFGSGMFARTLGQPTLEDLLPGQLRALLLEYGYTLPVVTYESSEAERKAGLDAIRKFNQAPKDELLKLAEDFGVMA